MGKIKRREFGKEKEIDIKMISNERLTLLSSYKWQIDNVDGVNAIAHIYILFLMNVFNAVTTYVPWSTVDSIGKYEPYEERT